MEAIERKVVCIHDGILKRKQNIITTVLHNSTSEKGDSEWSYWVEKDLGSQFGAVISSHAIYILGANRENDSEPSSKVIIYNKMSKQWMEGPAMNTPRFVITFECETLF